MIRDPFAPRSEASDLEVRLGDPTDSRTEYARIRCPGLLSAGRSPTAHLILPAADRHAAPIHFLLELAPTFCRLTNVGDRGTFVNGMLVRSQCDLQHADLIRAGASVFRVELLRGSQPAELPRSPTVLVRPVGSTTQPPAPEPPPPPPPTHPPAEPLMRLPGYQLLRSLGRGGMGTVWLAEDGKGEPVACKLILPHQALDPDSCARFRRETNHLRDLKHRHIVGFRDAGEYQGQLYLVMDYVAGCNLADLLAREGRLAVGRAVRLACQILEALGEAHNNGVVHRDVKPSNVLIQNGPEGEEIRLADFGLAKAYQAADGEVTGVGVIGGTLAYAAPEMVSDFRLAGPLADQYGAAATLYTLLTGSHLHDTANVALLLDAIRTQDPVPLTQRRPDVPAALAAIVHRALSREARSRFPTVRALRDAFAPFAASS